MKKVIRNKRNDNNFPHRTQSSLHFHLMNSVDFEYEENDRRLSQYVYFKIFMLSNSGKTSTDWPIPKQVGLEGCFSRYKITHSQTPHWAEANKLLLNYDFLSDTQFNCVSYNGNLVSISRFPYLNWSQSTFIFTDSLSKNTDIEGSSEIAFSCKPEFLT